MSAVACIVAPYSIACALFERSLANSPMSLPGENAFSPAPRRMMQRIPSSAESASIASPSIRHMLRVSALSFSGRLSVTVAIAPSRATPMSDDACASVGPDIEFLDELLVLAELVLDERGERLRRSRAELHALR